MAEDSKVADGLFALFVGLCAWVIPGAGHLVLREKTRGIIIFISIAALFTLGIYIGSIGIIDPVNEKLWYISQLLNSPIVALFGRLTVIRGYESFGKPNEIGQIYIFTSGMLNLLCIVNAIYLAHCKKTEVR